MKHDSLILASGSPRRRVLLAELDVVFEVVPCTLPEPSAKPERVAPAAWATALAYFKAAAVAREHVDRWVLGADTVVACRGMLLGKPRGRDDARRMLELQAGVRSDVITGLALVRVGGAVERRLTHAATGVWMRDDAATRAVYLQSGDWAGKAGAYGIQTVGDALVERLAGSFSNVVGLPLATTAKLLAAAGYRPASPPADA